MKNVVELKVCPNCKEKIGINDIECPFCKHIDDPKYKKYNEKLEQKKKSKKNKKKSKKKKENNIYKLFLYMPFIFYMYFAFIKFSDIFTDEKILKDNLIVIIIYLILVILDIICFYLKKIWIFIIMVIEFIIALINLILSIKFIDNNGSIISQLIIFASALIFVIGSKFIYLTKLNKKKIKSNKNK